ncbi:PREDICTED: uncharacterized protein LOC106105848 [Papilio polytes]|uniref:uncharacterized protein LOC106105848 n=1 Tax=Papilio polytes TaxID=76194 RepID=UPI0006762F88|nr:PREDICTED: uncharacterized protein LOC106105848 [Papilio polytes]
MGTKEEIVIICHGCLSADRNVTPLGELSGLFNILMPQICINEGVQLCWECRSILKKTRRFQQRIQQAQILMQKPHLLINYSISSLSTLKSKIIDSKCIVHESYKENKGLLDLKIEQELDESSDDEICEDFKGRKEVTEIKNEVVEHLMKDTKIEIEIEQSNVSVDSNVDNKINDSSEDEIKEIINKKSIKRNIRN